jgi:hypothetical protein
VGEGSVEQPDDGYEEEQNGEEHEGDVASGGGFLTRLGAGNAEGVDECVDYKAKWIHDLGSPAMAGSFGYGCFCLCSSCSMLRPV